MNNVLFCYEFKLSRNFKITGSTPLWNFSKSWHISRVLTNKTFYHKSCKKTLLLYFIDSSQDIYVISIIFYVSIVVCIRRLLTIMQRHSPTMMTTTECGKRWFTAHTTWSCIIGYPFWRWFCSFRQIACWWEDAPRWWLFLIISMWCCIVTQTDTSTSQTISILSLMITSIFFLKNFFIWFWIFLFLKNSIIWLWIYFFRWTYTLLWSYWSLITVTLSNYVLFACTKLK